MYGTDARYMKIVKHEKIQRKGASFWGFWETVLQNGLRFRNSKSLIPTTAAATTIYRCCCCCYYYYYYYYYDGYYDYYDDDNYNCNCNHHYHYHYQN